jgi:NADPH2:quinone reductase
MTPGMDAVLLTAHGGPEVLGDGTWPLPVPAAGELRIRIRAAGFNPVDARWRRGQGSPPLPCILGRDLAGTVDAVGQGVQGFALGDRVLAYVSARASNGTYAQATCLPAALVAHLPHTLDFTQGAALPVVGLTAHHVVSLHGAARAGQVAFVAGGSGGVGAMVLPMLSALGVRALTTATSAQSAAQLATQHALPPEAILRCDLVSQERCGDWVGARAPEGIDLAIDLVGGALKRLCFQVTAPGGRVVSIVEERPGFALDLWDEATSPLITRSIGFHFVQLGARAIHGSPASLALYGKELSALAEQVARGALPLPPIEVLGELSAETVRRAHLLLDARRGGAKRVMTVP